MMKSFPHVTCPRLTLKDRWETESNIMWGPSLGPGPLDSGLGLSQSPPSEVFQTDKRGWRLWHYNGPALLP